uniref:DC-STAMP domain-containing protein 2 n=1 Tax=Lonchura striata TaxID=40157 RepID=UPI001293FF60|nr:DC-STAMP domain-containing protein 2 [Lonchura striata domestica]
MGPPPGSGRAPRGRRGPGAGGEARGFARSLGGLALGLLLAGAYGALALLVQGHGAWHCLGAAVLLGAGAGLGMAFSSRARMLVLLALPHFFTHYKIDYFLPYYETESFLADYEIDYFLADYETESFLADYETESFLSIYATDYFLSDYETESFLSVYATDSFLCNYETDSFLADYETESFLEDYGTESFLSDYETDYFLSDYETESLLADYEIDYLLSDYNTDSFLSDYGTDSCPFFAGEGKVLIMMLALCLTVQGPGTNLLHNVSQVAKALSCGAELARNQTAERLQRAKEPLLNVQKKIKDIGQNAKVLGDRVRKFVRSIMDSTRHVARALRNVWLWLSRAGSICNRELGDPKSRCFRYMDKTKDRCERAFPLLFHFCYVVLSFKALCGMMSTCESLSLFAFTFCTIPKFIQTFIRINVAAPLTTALNRVRAEFEFNISVVHHFSVNLNASKSLGEVSADMMEAVKQHMEPYHHALELFSYVSFLAILFLCYCAVRYRRRYLRDDTFDNVYITRRFVELDLRCAEQGKPTVLPLSSLERGRYIPPGALWLSRRERRQYGLQLFSFLRHTLLGFSIILADYGIFWLLDLFRHQLSAEIVAKAPSTMTISVNGTGYTSEIYKDLVSAFNALQEGEVSVLSQVCLIEPVEPDHSTYITIGILYGIWLFISIFGSYMARLRRAVCAAYFPSREQERLAFLHNIIRARREWVMFALRQVGTRRLADTGKSRFFLILISRFPLLARLARRLGIQRKHCLTCGMAEQPDFTACITPNCTGLYCSECCRILNTCSVCMAPLSSPASGDEEMDSSDEETPGLWLGTERALRGQERGRRLLQRIKDTIEGWRLPFGTAARLQEQLQEKEEEESERLLSSRDFDDEEQAVGRDEELQEVLVVQTPSRAPSPLENPTDINSVGETPRARKRPNTSELRCPAPLLSRPAGGGSGAHAVLPTQP